MLLLTLAGRTWRFPADVLGAGRSHAAPPLAAVLGNMYNFELEGHLDTIVLSGEGLGC